MTKEFRDPFLSDEGFWQFNSQTSQTTKRCCCYEVNRCFAEIYKASAEQCLSEESVLLKPCMHFDPGLLNR